MKKFFFIILVIISQLRGSACTNFLITPGATINGAAYIFYSNDGEYAPHFPVYLAEDYAAGTLVSIKKTYWSDESTKIEQSRHTNQTLSYLINEYQVAVGETTFDGRKELLKTDGAIPYWTLMRLGLQRAKTAREFIKVVAELLDKYGYASTGESFSIADPKEVWYMELIGKGKGQKGAVWVALRVPDGYVAAHANHSRIRNFKFQKKNRWNDPKAKVFNSKDVVSFAIKKGYYDPKSGKKFSFSDAYDPADAEKLRYTEMRVWEFFRRVAPSLHLKPDYARGVKDARPYPLWVKPDKKLSLEDIMNLSRDYYEGTPFDMSKGLKAGPFGSPYRPRPLSFEIDGKKGVWGRSISTPNTAFAMIAELRANMPRFIGAVLWIGFDNTYTNVYIPVSAIVSHTPTQFNNTNYNKFSWSSLWWTFNFVGNYINLRYNAMIKDVKAKQNEIQKRFIADRRQLEKRLMNINDKNKIVQISTQNAQKLTDTLANEWHELANTLIVKYNDFYIRPAVNKWPRAVGYSKEWTREVIKSDSTLLLPD